MDINLREKLVLDNLNLARHFAKNINSDSFNRDDIESASNFGLFKAARTFDENKQIKFATYASRCIKNEILMFIRDNKKHTNNISLYEPISYSNSKCDGNPITLFDTLSDASSEFQNTISNKDIVSAALSIILNYFKYKEKLILLYSISGMKQKEISDIMNLSQSHISRLVKRCICTIKKLISLNIGYEKKVLVDTGTKITLTFTPENTSSLDTILFNLSCIANKFDMASSIAILCKGDSISISFPIYREYFAFIARAIQQINSYELKFFSNRSH